MENLPKEEISSLNDWASYKNVDPNKELSSNRKSYVLRKKRIAEFITKKDKVLDIGAFNNDQLKYLNLDDNSQYCPVDINPFTPNTIVADVTKEKLPFKDENFDKIIAAGVIEHLDNPIFALKEMGRVLKKEGKLIVMVSNTENVVKIIASILYEKKYINRKSPEHCLAFGVEEICNLLKRASFEVVHFEKRNPEIVSFRLILPEWKIFKPFTSDIIAVAKRIE